MNVKAGEWQSLDRLEKMNLIIYHAENNKVWTKKKRPDLLLGEVNRANQKETLTK